MASKSTSEKKRSCNLFTLNTKFEIIKRPNAEMSQKSVISSKTMSTIINAKDKVVKEINSATIVNTKVIRKCDSLIEDVETLLLV